MAVRAPAKTAVLTVVPMAAQVTARPTVARDRVTMVAPMVVPSTARPMVAREQVMTAALTGALTAEPTADRH